MDKSIVTVSAVAESSCCGCNSQLTVFAPVSRSTTALSKCCPVSQQGLRDQHDAQAWYLMHCTRVMVAHAWDWSEVWLTVSPGMCTRLWQSKLKTTRNKQHLCCSIETVCESVTSPTAKRKAKHRCPNTCVLLHVIKASVPVNHSCDSLTLLYWLVCYMYCIPSFIPGHV